MSENKSQSSQELSVVPERNLPADLTQQEKDTLFSFQQNGMPGLLKMTDEKMVKMKDLYMQGASYDSIAETFRTKKALVLFIGFKGNWLQERTERSQATVKIIEEVLPSIVNDNIVFLAEISQFFKSYYRKKIQEYNESGNDEVVRTTSLAGLEKYMKAFKMLQDATSKDEDGNSKNPAVHVHVGEGSNVSISDNSKQDSTQDNEKLSDALRLLAELRKKREE